MLECMSAESVMTSKISLVVYFLKGFYINLLLLELCAKVFCQFVNLVALTTV